MKGQRIAKNQLAKGLYIKLPLRWHEHPFLRSSFEIQSREEIALIKKLPLDYVLYFPEKSHARPQQAIDVLSGTGKESTPEPETVLELSIELHKEKQNFIKEMTALRSRQDECAQKYKQCTAMLRNSTSELSRDPTRALRDLKDLSGAIVEIAGDGALSLNLIDQQLKDDDHFYHMTNVAVLSLMVANMRGYSTSERSDLIEGAFLHDVGYIDMTQPFGADGKPNMSSANRWKEQHPIVGMKFLQGFPTVSENVLNIVRNHHEYIDGSGFPNKLRGNEVDEMSQIVSIANMYDELCRPQANGKAYQPSSAVSLLYKKMKHKFREDILQHFIKVIGVYPPASVVMLSDQSVAMVLSNHPSSLLTPKVVIYDPMIPRDQAPIIDLSKTELTVKSTIKRTSIPQHVYDYLCPSSKFYYFFDTPE